MHHFEKHSPFCQEALVLQLHQMGLEDPKLEHIGTLSYVLEKNKWC